MRATVDVVLDNPGSTPGDLRGMAADIRAAVDHAEHLIGALLILARNERGLTVREQVDLATVAEDVLDTAALAGRRVHATLEPAVISGDPPFQRLHDRTSHDGSGLGLAIVASIAAIHGGTTTARPRDDGGLTVTVTIPSAGAPAQATADQPESSIVNSTSPGDRITTMPGGPAG